MLYESSYYGVCNLGDSLTHHGIKGQKWGIRRFQDINGRLTEAGRIRYSTAMAKKYGLREKNPNGDQAWDNARDMASRGASKREVKKYLKVNKLPTKEWFEDNPYNDYKEQAKAYKRAEKRDEAVAKGDVEKIMKYAPELSTQQLNDAVNRAALMKRLSDLDSKPKKEFLKSFTETGNNIVGAVTTVKKLKELFKKEEKEEKEDPKEKAFRTTVNTLAVEASKEARTQNKGTAEEKARAGNEAYQAVVKEMMNNRTTVSKPKKSKSEESSDTKDNKDSEEPKKVKKKKKKFSINLGEIKP